MKVAVYLPESYDGMLAFMGIITKDETQIQIQFAGEPLSADKSYPNVKGQQPTPPFPLCTYYP